MNLCVDAKTEKYLFIGKNKSSYNSKMKRVAVAEGIAIGRRPSSVTCSSLP